MESGGGDALRAAPTFSQRYEEIAAIIDTRPVLIYNADFDERLIVATIKRHGLPEPPWVVLCDESVCKILWRMVGLSPVIHLEAIGFCG